MRTDDLANLDAPLRLFRDIAVGQLPSGDDVAVAPLDHVTIRVNLGDEQALVSLNAVRYVVQVRTDVEALDLTFDASLGLHFNLDPSTRFRTFGNLDRVQVQVRGGSGQAFDRDA